MLLSSIMLSRLEGGYKGAVTHDNRFISLLKITVSNYGDDNYYH